MVDTLFKISTAYSVSGAEENALFAAQELLKQCCDVTVDFNGNLMAVFGDKNSDYNIMLDAHIDQIGFIVTYINDSGFIKVDGCGGIDRRVLAGSPIKILGKQEIFSVVCCLPPHLTDGGEDKAMSGDSIWLDTGLSSAEVNDLVSLGDRAVMYCQPKMLLGSRISSLALDNSAGVAALILCAKALYGERLNCKVTILLSSQEETGCLGAKTGAFTVSPNEAISVDVSFANQPDVASHQCGKMSNGPMIGISPILNKSMVSSLQKTAEENSIPYQLEIMGGTTGTTADCISVTGSGIKTALVSIPLRNMHTQAEVIDLNDLENTSMLLCKYIIKRSTELK